MESSYKMKNFFIIFLMVLKLQVSLGFDSQDSNSEVYYKTKKLCNGKFLDTMIQLGNIWNSSFKSSGVITTAIDGISEAKFRQLNVGDELDALTSDLGYFKAVSECFGDDEEKRNLFFIGLLGADLIGKGSAWALDFSFLRPFYYGVRGVFAAGQVAIPVRMMWFRVIFKVSNKYKSIYLKLLDPTVFLTFLSSSYANIVGNEKVKNHIVIDRLQKNDPFAKSLINDLKDLEVVLANTTDPKDRSVIDFLIERQKQAIQENTEFYEKSRREL